MSQGDRVDMDSDGVRTAMTGLENTGSTFHSAWSTATAAGAGGLGQGPMGAAFLAGFNPGVQRLGDEAARIAQRIRETADAGYDAVVHYRDADTNAERVFRLDGDADGRR